MSEVVNGHQRNHFRGLCLAASLWLKMLCSYFSSPHKYWSNFSHIVTSHCWLVRSDAVCSGGFSLWLERDQEDPSLTHLNLSVLFFSKLFIYMAHFLHNEQQLLAKRIGLPTPQTLRGALLSSFSIDFHLYLCSQILTVRLPAGRCSAHKCFCNNCLTPSQLSFIVWILLWRPLLQQVCVTLKTCSPSVHSWAGNQNENLFAK